jgi:hypothetical protein
MKLNWMIGAAFVMLAACQSEPAATEEKTAAAPEAKTEEAPLPMDVAYKGEPSIGSRENMAVVMNWNKSLSEKNPAAAAALLADSVEVTLADGTYFNTTRDSLMSVVTNMINSFDSVKVDFVALLPVNVKTDKGTDEWVFSWTDEKYSNAKGKEHNNIHEDYLIKNGKIAVVFQYAQKPPAPAAKK